MQHRGTAGGRRSGRGLTLVLVLVAVLGVGTAVGAAGLLYGPALTGTALSGAARSGTASPVPDANTPLSTPAAASANPVPPLPATAPRTTGALASSAPSGIVIPSLRVDTTDVDTVGLLADRSLQVPTDPAHIGWYRGSSSPGRDGPAVFAGHVQFRGEDGAFVDLSRMKPGDLVRVARADGTTVDFVTDRVTQVDKDAFPTQQVYGDTDRPEIRLITCGGVFDRAKRSFDDNIVVYGHMTTAYRA